MSANPPARSLPRGRVWIAVGLLLAIIGGIAWFTLRSSSAATPARPYDLIQPQRGTITAVVNATGQIAAAQTASLSLISPGRVAEVLAVVGQQVDANAPLVRLDTAELTLRLRQSQAQLQQAQASRDKLVEGVAPADRASAEAQLRQSQAQLRQTSGSVSAADITAAEATLEQAQTLLQAAEAGPDPTQLALADQALAQSQAQLQQQRDQLSAAKTNAAAALEQASASLTQAQARYATAKSNWEYVQSTGNDPIVPNVSDPTKPGGRKPNKLSEGQQRQYYDAFVQAEAQLHSSEEGLKQAQVSADNARSAEVNGIKVAEQQVAQAQTRRDQTAGGATPDQLAQARAAVANAQATLNRLRGDQRQGQLAGAQAAVDQSQARLQQLSADPRQADLALSDAQVLAATAARDLAQLQVDQATLRAPFAGTIAEVNVQVGENVSAAKPAVVLADLAGFAIDVRVDEIDIARLAVGQPVTLTLDALRETPLAGSIQTIAPLAAAASAVTAYGVRIAATSTDPRVRPGMSASADITVDRKDGALLLPRRAVRNDRGRIVVDTAPAAACATPREQRTVKPQLTAVEVRTGLSNELLIEVLSGVDEQTCVYIEGIDARLRNFIGGGGPPRPPQR